MKIIQHTKSGNAEIKFSWREVWIILKKRKLTLSPEGLQVFGNSLLKIIMDWNLDNITKIEEKDGK